jgi:hypothetical protein
LLALAGRGGWKDTDVTLTSGDWTDVVTGAVVAGDLLAAFSVAVLERTP